MLCHSIQGQFLLETVLNSGHVLFALHSSIFVYSKDRIMKNDNV